MSEARSQRRANDPYESVPKWRADEIEKRIDRAERRTERLESRLSERRTDVPSQTQLELGLIWIYVLPSIVLMVVAIASHH